MDWKNATLISIIKSSLFDICFIKPECSVIKEKNFMHHQLFVSNLFIAKKIFFIIC